MKKHLVFAITYLFFTVSFAELYSPEVWHSFRSDTLKFSAGVTDEDSGKTVHYELLLKDQNEKSTAISMKTVKAVEKEWTLEFLGIKRDVTGKDALWIKETVVGNANSKTYGPYGLVRTKLLENCDSVSAFSGDVRKFSVGINESYKFAYNKNGLIVALNNSKGNLTISLDPANSKTAFLAFANRIIRFNVNAEDENEDKIVEFLYPERNVENKTATVQYKVRDWEGDMKVYDVDNGKVLFIPWYDFGIIFENGRKFGFMVNGDNFAYPVKASQYSPASWGNIILK